MTSRASSFLSPPSWGGSLRLPIGGFATLAFCALLWALFLGAIRSSADRGAPPGAAAYAVRAGEAR